MTNKEMSDFINSLWCWDRCTEEEKQKLSEIADYLSNRGNEKNDCISRERIEDFREIVLPFLSRTLLKTNYENMGKSDAEELEKDFNEILDLAIKALEQEPTTKNDSPKYCDRSICLKNEYNNVGCEDCEVTKSQEPTTKNDLGVDCISRQAVLDIIRFEDKWLLDAKGHNADTEIAFSGMKSRIAELPSVTPQEPQTFKWCDTCKEYDQEKHCCHRYSEVIRDT